MTKECQCLCCQRARIRERRDHRFALYASIYAFLAVVLLLWSVGRGG